MPQKVPSDLGISQCENATSARDQPPAALILPIIF
jgi:hypothetical protein